MRKWRMKLVFLFTILGAVGVVAIIPYEMATLSNTSTIPDALVAVINSITKIVFLFVMVLIGVRLQKRTGLNAPILDSLVYKKERHPVSKKWLNIGIFIALIGAFITILLDLFVFSPLMEIPEDQTPVTIWWQGLLAMLYGGITEELMLRLFGMTLIVWILAWITRKEKENIPSVYYYIAIFLAAILFGLGHLPAALQVFGGLSAVIIIRTLVLNSLLGLWFGYLYWKKGLEYAMIAHMSADFLLHFLFASILY